jgi:hypothetical protein
MDYVSVSETEIKVIDFDDEFIGFLKIGIEEYGDSMFWHFYPNPGIAMNCGICRRIMFKLAELNKQPRPSLIDEQQ